MSKKMSDAERDNLLQWLEEWQLKNRITQAELGALLGVTQVTINLWTCGNRRPGRQSIYQIQKLLRGDLLEEG